MVPQHLRMLTHFVGREGWSTIDLRSLSLATGIDYRYMVVVLDSLEATGMLQIQRGRSDADPEGAAASSYLLTDKGRAVVPEVLRQPLTGNFALNHPMWSYKGYGMHGLVTALTLGPGEHEVGSAVLAKILGCDRRSAIKRLAAWAEKGWAKRLNRSTYVLMVPDADPEQSLIEIEAYVPEQAYESAERKAAWVQASRAAKKAAKQIIEEVGHWIPAALAKIREAGILAMEEFFAQTDRVLSTPVCTVAGEEMMEALRRRGHPLHN